MAQGAMHQPGDRALITYDDFLDWADEDTLAEWVDGQVIMTSPANRRHQDIAKFLLLTEERQMRPVATNSTTMTSKRPMPPPP